jgi:aminopeptidase N
MYICGNRELAGQLTSLLQENASRAEGVSFSLPGDKPVYAPDRAADVRHVELDVTLDFAEKRVSGAVTTTFAALFEEVAEVTLDAAELQIERITMEGHQKPLDYWVDGEKLHIRLGRTYHHGQEFAVRIQYSAQPREGLVFVAPEEGNPELPLQVWTQGETQYHHYWFPCHDFPNDRATVASNIRVPSKFFVLANGKLEQAADNGDGTKTYSWRMEQPIPAYLITLVAGEFSELPAKWRDVPVPSYVRTGREDDGHRMFDKTPAMIEFFAQRFGVDYPYVKYAQVVAETFLGAMENTTATTHTYRLLADKRASLDFTPEPVVAHELVHQWHGDMIAVRDWSHTWLKESFATYFAAAWMQHDQGEDEFRTELLADLRSYLEADKRGRRPIVYNVYRKNGNELFDRHVYEKGSLTLHMLRQILGEEPFWRAIQTYTQRNQWREAITADLERAVEEATGRSMAQFFEQWHYKAGHPEFQVRYSWDDGQRMAKLTVKQMQQVDERTPLFVTPVDLGFMVPERDDLSSDDADARASLTTIRVTLDQAEQTFYIPLPHRPLSVRFDQGAWLIKTLDFERPADLLRYQLTHDPDVVGRIEAAEALGKLHDLQSIAALERRLLEEPFWSVKGAIAEALAGQKSERALNALLHALDELDPTKEPKARRAIVAALGQFHAPEQAALAERAAQALRRIVEQGDPSYYVEAEAAVTLGKTHVADAYDVLLAKVDTPSWNEIIRGGVFAGLGELGDARVVDVLARWATDRAKPMDARAAAARGLAALAGTKRIDPGEAHTKAVTALIAVLDDPWTMAQYAACAALAEWGDARAIPALEAFIARSTDEAAVRLARTAIRRLQRGNSASEETRQLRRDLDELREANRALRERLDAMEARNGSTDGAGNHASPAPARARKRTPKAATV